MKKTILAILAAVLALSLMLTACSKGGETSGDNSTGGTSSTAGTTSGGADSIDTTKPYMKDGKLVFPNVPNYNEYFSKDFRYEEGMEIIRNEHDKLTKVTGGVTGVDIPTAINGAIEKYGKYFLDYIPDYILMGAVHPMLTGTPLLRQESGNVTAITDDALAKANKFLTDNGFDALDAKDPEQNIAAFAVAALLFHNGEEKTYADEWFLIDAFGNACHNSDEKEKINYYESELLSRYMKFLV